MTDQSPANIVQGDSAGYTHNPEATPIFTI